MENALCGFKFGGDPIRHGFGGGDVRGQNWSRAAISACIEKHSVSRKLCASRRG